MIKESVSVDEVIIYLNGLLELDRSAVAALVSNRVPCRDGLVQHESVVCDAQHGGHLVGLLGVVNGMFGYDETKQTGPIAACYGHQENGEFRDLVRFERVDRDTGNQAE